MPQPDNESGMTLIEMLIAISVLGIIIGPITMSLMLGLLSSNGTKERISDSAAAQLLSAYLVTDVESSKTVQDPGPTPVASGECGHSPSIASIAVVRFTWIDGDLDPSVPAPAAKQTVVSYVKRQTGDDGLHELWRIECDGANVERSSQRLVRSLQTALARCGASSTACPATASGAPDRVRLDVTVNANSGTNARKADATVYDPYVFTLQAQRRETVTTP
jgi:prepilin-type N-terminal cleavage/methylation domain-containing protein